jgi:hypothetical protein
MTDDPASTAFRLDGEVALITGGAADWASVGRTGFAVHLGNFD